LDNGEKWIASGSGVSTYDGSSWRYFDTSNSALPDNFTSSLMIDAREGSEWEQLLAD